MADEQFHVVYDIGDAGYRSWAVGILPLLITIGGIAFLFVVRWRHFPRWRRALVSVAVGIAFAGSALVVSSTYVQYRNLVRDYRGGVASYVEGSVEHFVPMPRGGHANERFDVGGQHFEYSKFQIREGFNGSVVPRSPLREGIGVRIWHLGGTIVRLEVADGP
jgi:hypothetical protein